MATEENKETKSQSQENSNEQSNNDNRGFETVEQALARISELENINKQVIQDRDSVKSKLREIESEEEEAKRQAMEEQGQFKTLLEAEREKLTSLQNKLRDRDIDSAIGSALKDVGLTEDAFNTAKALIDKSTIGYDQDKGIDSTTLTKAVEQLKANHSILFQAKPKTPDTKRPSGNVDGGSDFVTEMKKLRESGNCTHAKINELRKRFGVDK